MNLVRCPDPPVPRPAPGFGPSRKPTAEANVKREQLNDRSPGCTSWHCYRCRKPDSRTLSGPRRSGRAAGAAAGAAWAALAFQWPICPPAGRLAGLRALRVSPGPTLSGPVEDRGSRLQAARRAPVRGSYLGSTCHSSARRRPKICAASCSVGESAPRCGNARPPVCIKLGARVATKEPEQTPHD